MEVLMRLGLLTLAAGVAKLAPVAGQRAGGQRPEGQGTVRERATLRGHTNSARSGAFAPDGTMLASGSSDWASDYRDQTIKLWDVATGKERATLRGHGKGVRSVAYSPDGNTLASGSADWTIGLWLAGRSKKRATLE